MDLFSNFCNICYKTSVGNLKDISEENMKHLKDSLITFVGHADIIKHNVLYLCQLCCEELTRFDKFREMCFSNLIHLRQRYFNMKCKLEMEEDMVVVKNTLKSFVHAVVLERNSLEKCHEITNSSEYLNKNGSISNRKVNDSYTSQIEPMKELNLKKETAGRVSTDFTHKHFGNESDEPVNLVEMPVVNNSKGPVNLGVEYMNEEIHVKEESLEVETTENESSGRRNVAFEFVNVCTTVNMPDCEDKDIRSQQVKVEAKLPSSDCNSELTAEKTDKEHQNASETSNNRDTTVQPSIAQNRVDSSAAHHTCGVCNKVFRNSSSLKKHERLHSEDRPHKCTVCNNAFTSAAHLIAHERTHSGDRPYECTDCKKTFKQLYTLTIHKRTHTGDRPYKCTVCNKTFTQAANLITHERTHSGDRPYKCNVCSKAFTQLSALTIHDRTHTGDRPYECTVCNKTFTGSYHLTKHARTHSGDRPYKCNVCNKTFADSSNLTAHERTHSGDRPYKCSICNKAFAQLSNLTTHKYIHSDDKPYKCTVCNKAFTNTNFLNKHKRIHSAERPNKCTVCKKAFTMFADLMRHERTHNIERPHKCNVCDKTFTQASHVSKHERIHGNVCIKAHTNVL